MTAVFASPTSSVVDSSSGSFVIDLDNGMADQLIAMLQQEEESCYSDCVSCLIQKKKESHIKDGSSCCHLNDTWREKICQWSYNVLDHFDLSRELAAVSMDLFDRYMAYRGNECSGQVALLTSLTTLNIACKLHISHDTNQTISMATLISLSRGQFERQNIEEMEMTILQALQWKLHAPTLYSFITHFIALLPPFPTSVSVQKELFDLAGYLTELAVCDSYFVGKTKSVVAWAAILNVMEEMPYSRVSKNIRTRFVRTVTEITFRANDHHQSPSGVRDIIADSAIVSARARLRSMFSSFSSNPIISSSSSSDSSLSSSKSSSSLLSSSSWDETPPAKFDETSDTPKRKMMNTETWVDDDDSPTECSRSKTYIIKPPRARSYSFESLLDGTREHRQLQQQYHHLSQQHYYSQRLHYPPPPPPPHHHRMHYSHQHHSCHHHIQHPHHNPHRRRARSRATQLSCSPLVAGAQ